MGLSIAGLVVRVLYVLLSHPYVNIGLDAVWYQLEGGALAGGHGYIDPEQFFEHGRTVATAFRPPLYPGFLAGVIKLFGDASQTLQLAGAATGALSIALIGLLGRRLAGAQVGIVAAAMAVVSPALIGFDGSLMSETLYVPIVTGLILAVDAAIDRPTLLRWAGVGALCGLGMLTRGDAVVLFAALVIPMIVLVRRPWRSRGALVVAAVLGVSIVVGPWVARNQATLGRPTLATLDAGTAIAGTNCAATYRGRLLGFWEHRCTVRPGDANTGEVERNDRLQREGFEYAFDHVDRWPIVVPVRVLRLWGFWDPIHQASLEKVESRNFSWQILTWAVHLVTIGFTIAGFLLMARRRLRWQPLAAVIVSVTVAAALSYGKQRFRAAAEPALLVAAAVAVTELLRRRTRARATISG